MLKIPTFKMPSNEELTANAYEWFKPLEHVCFESWNNNLKEVSYPMHNIKLSVDMCRMILDVENRNTTKEEKLQLFEELVNPFLEKLDFNEYFIKLTSRSPKDFLYDDRNGAVLSCKSAEDILIAIQNSMRTFEDLCRFLYLDGCNLWIRPFMKIETRNEWRVFCYDGEVTGISQYYYYEDFKYDETELIETELDIRAFVDTVIFPNVNLDSFVVDVVIDNGKIMLLEMNPYGLSDPCLFRSYDNIRKEMVWLDSTL